ncbi:MAG: hypothetical protein A2857_05570 [Candidatus Levybacteria bacterium RIFCSPHIGHO2_01_FULL_36_15]|nr:MAG: hypothetical protein A2857_05570 [Candidatus Levybacteria bacterium RIFCSPHIGHO2_01_FULL_36_15]OGH38987.1 MAG: hypothetical protein A2905_04720 [Candidatus Levybacteria bacterium RIFCSPLOWO2_01_FULL_36_10]
MSEDGVERLAVSEPTVETPLEDIQGYLVDEAKSALGQFTFDARNSRMAKAVGLESAILAAKSTGHVDAADRLRDIFTQASEEAGSTFSGAFDETGRKLEDKNDIYNSAMSAAGQVALRHLPAALEAIGSNVDVQTLLRDTDFNDVLRLTARELGQPVPQGLTPEEVKRSLHETAKGDYFEDQIDTLPFSDKPQLTKQQEQTEQTLDMAVRLANATWKVGQVHRAAWEGNDGRINPAKREAFNPFDLLKKEQYNRVVKEGRSPQDALVRVGLEVYKDVIQYKPLVAQPPTPGR